MASDPAAATANKQRKSNKQTSRPRNPVDLSAILDPNDENLGRAAHTVNPPAGPSTARASALAPAPGLVVLANATSAAAEALNAALPWVAGMSKPKQLPFRLSCLDSVMSSSC
jgi:hypothetical protein